MTQKLIHLIDDDSGVRQSLRLSLQSAEYVVDDYESPFEFIENLDDSTVGCVLTDLHMPELNGAMLIQQIRKTGSNIPVVVMTGNSHHQSVTTLIDQGVPVLEKPFRCEELFDVLDKSIDSPKT